MRVSQKKECQQLNNIKFKYQLHKNEIESCVLYFRGICHPPSAKLIYYILLLLAHISMLETCVQTNPKIQDFFWLLHPCWLSDKAAGFCVCLLVKFMISEISGYSESLLPNTVISSDLFKTKNVSQVKYLLPSCSNISILPRDFTAVSWFSSFADFIWIDWKGL